ncbi:hypothetical protein GJ496_002881 [Pomphorhynchus laevis]|nr:hypothetical protein GJ496_002881 [Pomphorhynchus laevis]
MEKVKLFGDNLSIVLPIERVDASEARILPLNQEVFMHPRCNNSIIIEFLEKLDSTNDETAAMDHFDEISRSNDAIDKEIKVLRKLNADEFVLKNCTVALYLSGTNTFRDNSPDELITIDFILFRLPTYSTDLIVTYNNAENQDFENWPSSLALEIAKSLEITNFGMLV